MSLLTTLGPLVGRALLSAIFVWSGMYKLQHLSQVARLVAQVRVPYPTASALIAGVVELAGGVALLLGMRARAAALLLLLYVLFLTWLFHWPTQTTEIFKNAAIMGGLVGIASNGPGPLSVNR